MRRFALAATAVAALTAGLQTPAFAAAPAVPTDVTVSWVAERVNLKWNDAGEANQIFAEYDGGTPTLIASVTGEDGNVASLANPLAASDKVRLIIKSVVGSEVSEGAATPVFDTRRPAVPVLQDANLAVNLTTSLTWTLAAVADQTPGDPLDL